jgi:hypothetical protein
LTTSVPKTGEAYTTMEDNYRTFLKEQSDKYLNSFLKSKGIERPIPSHYKLDENVISAYEANGIDLGGGCFLWLLVFVYPLITYKIIPNVVLNEINYRLISAILLGVICTIATQIVIRYYLIISATYRLDISWNECMISLKKFHSDTELYYENYCILTEEFERQVKIKYNNSVFEQKKGKSFWRSLSGHDFESEIGDLFLCNKVKCMVTKGSDDKGVDIVIQYNSRAIAVQCKNHHKKITPKDIRDFQGSVHSYKYDGGIFISTNGYTDKSIEQGCLTGLLMLDINDIIDYHKSVENGKIKQYLDSL